MSLCLEPTAEMGEYSVEVRRESFYLRGEDTYDGEKRHAIPKIRAALDQVEQHLA